MRIRAITLFFICAGLALAQAPSISDGGILNGASFTKGQAITPGSLISIFWDEFSVSKVSKRTPFPSRNPWAALPCCSSMGTQLSMPLCCSPTAHN